MPLPKSIRVKLSSEEAGSISITPVVVRDMPFRELIELMLGIVGKDAERIHELLLRGALVSGATRFRWEGCDAERSSIDALLATFPDPDPGRPFAPEHCVRAVLRGPGCRIDLPREIGAKRRFLHRSSLWDALMETVAAEQLRYVDYSYKERADCYQMKISSSAAARLRETARTARYSTLESQIRGATLETAELFVSRART